MDNLLKQGQNFTDTAGRTGVVNFDTQTGKPLATGQTTITPASLQPQPKIDLPQGNIPQGFDAQTYANFKKANPNLEPNAQDTSMMLNAGAKQNLASSFLDELALTSNEKSAQAGQENIVAKMLENIAGQQGESAYKTELLKGSGIDTLRKDLQGINSQILQKQAEVAQDDIKLVANMRAEERRDTLLPFAQMGQAKLAGDAAIMRALKTSEIGVLNALALGKQGDIALAKDMVNEAVDAKFAPYKEQNALYEAQLKAIQPFLTSAEKKQASAQAFKLAQATKEIDKVSDFQKTILANAISSNAPQSVINAISKGQSIEEITNAGKGYLRSKADILDERLKLLQMDKISFEMSQARTKEAKEAVALKQAAQAQLPKVKEELDAINNLLSNTLGLEKSTALTGIGRFKQLFTPKISLGEPSLKGTAKGFAKGGFPGAVAGSGAINVSSPVKNLEAKKDFTATVSQLTSTGTLNTLIEAKKNGATFGALSDAELALIQQSFSKLGSYAIRNKEGKITGFSASDDLIEEELRKIGDSTSRLYQSLGGVLEQGTPIGVQKADDFVDTALNQNINNYGYEF